MSLFRSLTLLWFDRADHSAASPAVALDVVLADLATVVAVLNAERPTDPRRRVWLFWHMWEDEHPEGGSERLVKDLRTLGDSWNTVLTSNEVWCIPPHIQYAGLWIEIHEPRGFKFCCCLPTCMIPSTKCPMMQ